MTQEQLFNEWCFILEKISGLKSFIQNNFDRMIEDEYIKKDEIKHSIPEFEDLFHRNILELTELKNKIIILMKEKSE